MGHDVTTGVLNPRGILNAALRGDGNITFNSWRVAGNAGGKARFYRTNMPLALPDGLDVSLAFKLHTPADSTLTVQLYFGKFVPYIEHHVVFPVFPGILNYHGNNTIGVNVWAQDAAGASMSVNVGVLGVQESGLDVSGIAGQETEYLWPGWTSEKLKNY